MSGAKVKFLDPAAIEAAIAEVAQVSESEHLEVALIGGVAMMAYGSDRLTKDVDVASVDEYPHPKTWKFVRALSFGGVSVLTGAGHPVDVVVRCDEYRGLYVEAIERAKDVGLPVRVVRPEHLAALKMAAAREKDITDLRMLIRSGILDLLATREIVRRHLGPYAARELDSIVAEVEWRKSREP